jgi:hypothetical protein
MARLAALQSQETASDISFILFADSESVFAP